MVTDYSVFFLHFQTTRVEQRTFCVLKNYLSQKMDQSGFRGEDSLEINQSETKLPVAAMFI
jgi:hypothetical protein